MQIITSLRIHVSHVGYSGYLSYVGLMLGERRRRWHYIKAGAMSSFERKIEAKN